MFRIKLSPALQARLDAEREEIANLFSLPDSLLAEELLRLARVIRSRTGFKVSDRSRDTYNSTLLHSVIPEVARRLGGKLLPDEVPYPELVALQGQGFRDYVGVCLVNVSRMHYKEADIGEVLDPVCVLFHDHHNGCPVAFALDRIAPPSPESGDPLARGMREVSGHRGFDPVGAWSPQLQDYARARQAEASDTVISL